MKLKQWRNYFGWKETKLKDIVVYVSNQLTYDSLYIYKHEPSVFIIQNPSPLHYIVNTKKETKGCGYYQNSITMQ